MLRPMLYVFDESEIHLQYQGLHVFQRFVREYLPAVAFMHRFEGYDFAWVAEYDIR